MPSRYKCPKCDTIYTYEEYKRLPVTHDPILTRVCPRCGARFWVDRMVLKDYVKVGQGVTIEVSTVDLEMEYEGGYFFETLLSFHKEEGRYVILPNDEVVAWYRTKEEAVKGHKRIVEMLRKGKGYKFVKTPELIIDWDKLEEAAKAHTY